MLRRTIDRGLVRDAAALGAAVIAIGVSFGAVAVSGGLPWWLAVGMSMLVFAGGAQFLAAGLLAVGNPAAALFGGLLLNARHLGFGFAVADVFDRGWPGRLVGSHLLVDESAAFAMAQRDPGRRRTSYWLVGATLFTTWNVGTVLGVLLGEAVPDPAALGLDATFPAALLALVLPSLRDPAARRVALTGAAVALLATPLLPPGAPVLCALAGLLALLVPGPPWWEGRSGTSPATRRPGGPPAPKREGVRT